MPFQTKVNSDPAPGLEGGWCAANIHTSMLTPDNGDPGAAGYVSWKVGAAGVTVGRFGFANTADGTVVSNNTAGLTTVRVGFVHRYQPVVLQLYLATANGTLYQGQEVDIVTTGPFWCRFPNGGTVGQKVFASTTDGSAIGTAVTGGTVTGGVETAWYLDSPVAAGDLGKISTRG